MCSAGLKYLHFLHYLTFQIQASSLVQSNHRKLQEMLILAMYDRPEKN